MTHSIKCATECFMSLASLGDEENTMKTVSTFLEQYYKIQKMLADLRDRVTELSNTRRKEILDAVRPLVEAEIRACEMAAKKLDAEECAAHEKEVDYIAKRLLSANDFSQDTSRFCKGLEADSKDSREDFHLKYHRQREIIFCQRSVLEHFIDKFAGIFKKHKKKMIIILWKEKSDSNFRRSRKI